MARMYSEAENSKAMQCKVVRAGSNYRNKQGLTYARGATEDSIGCHSLCLQVLTMKPGERAKAHAHCGVETVGYMIAGSLEIWYGEHLENRVVVNEGEYSFIPADVPHLVLNPSQDAKCTVAVAHGAGRPDNGLILLHELDKAFQASQSHNEAA